MKHYAKWLLGAAVAAGLGSGSIGWALAQGNETSRTGSVKTFVDIAGHWGEASIGTAVAKGYVDGYEDGSFKPDREVTRAEFVKLAITALALPVSGSSSGSNWYVPYVNAAVQHGLHDWTDFTSGDWNTPMTRYEMARMAARAAGQKTDDEKQWMYLATKAGLIQGMDDTGTLAVDGTTTRAQSVTIIERILDAKAGKTLPADKHAVSRAEVVWHKTNIFTVMPEFFPIISASNPWNPDDLSLATSDGKWKGTLDSLIAIDVSDPNAPGWELLPPIEELKWFNTRSIEGSFPVANYKDSYILVSTSHVDYNYDTSLYQSRVQWLPVFVAGLDTSNSNELLSGNLVTAATVFKTKPDDLRALIIPKNVKNIEWFSVNVTAPKIGGGEGKILVKAGFPKK